MHVGEAYRWSRIHVVPKQVARIEAEEEVVVGPEQDDGEGADPEQQGDGDPVPRAEATRELATAEQRARERRGEEQRPGTRVEALELTLLLDQTTNRLAVHEGQSCVVGVERTLLSGH